MTRRPGRPSKLTAEVIAKLEEGVRAGATLAACARYAGIHYDTFNRWINRGETAKSGEYHDFYEAIKKAQAEAELRNVLIINKAAADHWQAAAWWLERRMPESYGRRIDTMQHEGDISINFRWVTPDDDGDD